MTAAVATSDAGAPAVVPASPVSVARGYRFELVKLLSQWRVRLLIIACWVAPAVFVAAVSQQTTLPTDTLFGRWMNTTGWAAPLVMLGFAGTYALPLLTSLVAGDVFASEDRLGTWRHLLVAVRSYRRLFVAKALASLTVILVLVVGMAASSIVGGVLAVGNRALVGLDGHLLMPGDAALEVVLAWVSVLAPTLALAGIGLLGSVALGRSPMGLLLPVVVALAMALAQLLPLPVALRLALPSYAFISWNGLFTAPEQLGPLLISILVSLVWAVVATALAYVLFMRRDFTNLAYEGSGRRVLTAGALPLIGLVVVAFAVVAVATPSMGSGIEQDKLRRSLATTFSHLYVLQTAQLNRPAVTEEQLASSAACTKGDDLVAQEGPGNDWRCVVTWHLPTSKPLVRPSTSSTSLRTGGSSPMATGRRK